MKVSGFGVLTTKGLDIFAYCKLNDISLEFTDFLATSKNVDMNVLADSADATYGSITKEELITDLTGSTYYEAPISVSDHHYTTEDSTYLPLLLSIISNDYTEDLSIYSIFLLAKDPQTIKATITTPTNFTVGNTVTGSNGATGTIDYINTATKEIYITNITPSILGDGFVVGINVHDDVVLVDEAITAVDEAEYCVYMGCPSYDERMSFYVDDETGFAIGQTITTASGKSAEITDISGNFFVVNRNNILKFSNGDTITNGVESTTIISIPAIDFDESSVLPVTYISDGADILLRLSIRNTSGFPRSVTFLDTAIREIEVHNASDDAHIDVRLLPLLYSSEIARDLRDLKRRVDALVIKNGLNT